METKTQIDNSNGAAPKAAETEKKPARVKMLAIQNVYIMSKHLDPKFKGNELEMSNVAKGQQFDVPEEIAKDLERVEKGMPRFQGNRIEGEDDERTEHQYAKRIG